MEKNRKKVKRVFISGTYEDQIDLIEEIRSKLEGEGIAVVHFKSPEFYNGKVLVHPHDLCLQHVENTANYLLIVGQKAGEDYHGEDTTYQGLTVTHAEFRTALKTFDKDDSRSLFVFVRQRIMDSYYIWNSLSNSQRVGGSWPAEPKVYSLLDEIEQNKRWRQTFRNSRHMKELVESAMNHFVTESSLTIDEKINIDTISSYIRDKFPDKPPTPPEDLMIVTLELGRYGCHTISELDTKLKQVERAFAELDKEFRLNGIKGIHGGGVIRNSLWILDDQYYEKRITEFIAEQLIDRKRFREFI